MYIKKIIGFSHQLKALEERHRLGLVDVDYFKVKSNSLKQWIQYFKAKQRNGAVK